MYMPHFLFNFFIFKFLLEYSCLTMLCWFLLYSKVILYPLICHWALSLFPYLGYCKWCCNMEGRTVVARDWEQGEMERCSACLLLLLFSAPPYGMQNLSPLTRMEPVPLQWKHGVLTTGPPGKSRDVVQWISRFHYAR